MLTVDHLTVAYNGITAVHDVIHRSFIFYAKLARHTVRVEQSP